jgi:hypothetical protein
MLQRDVLFVRIVQTVNNVIIVNNVARLNVSSSQLPSFLYITAQRVFRSEAT